MKKKSIIALLCILILFALASSCQQNTDNASETTAPKEAAGMGESAQDENDSEIAPEEDPLAPDLPDEDFGGYVFRVISRGDDWHSYPVHSRDVWVEIEDGDTINDAVYRRNIEIEERFNIKIELTTMPELTGEGEMGPMNAVARSHQAGEDNYDLLIGHEIYIGTASASGHYRNWYDIPYVDLAKPWWNQEVVSQLSIGKRAFLALSDLSMGSYDNAYCILFNKEHHRNYQIENLYELVESGEWTFDKMYSIYKGMYTDIDGDSKRSINDFYGFIEGGGYLNWFWAGGNRIMQKNENNLPYYDLINERSTTTFFKASEMTLDPGCYRFNWWINEDIIPMFSNGNGLLLGTQIGSIGQLRSMEVDFGIIPYPKLDEYQDSYYTFVDAHSSLMAVPVMVGEIEKAGAIIEALSYESHKTVRPAYYDVALKSKFARDDESEKMLDIIFSGIVYDFDYVFCDWIVTYVFFDNLRDGKQNFVSGVERNMAKAQARLEKVIEAFEMIDN